MINYTLTSMGYGILSQSEAEICSKNLSICINNPPESARAVFVTSRGSRYYQNVNDGRIDIDCALVEGDTKITVRAGDKAWTLLPLHVKKVGDKYVVIPAPDLYGLISLLMETSHEQAERIGKLEKNVAKLERALEEFSGHDII